MKVLRRVDGVAGAAWSLGAGHSRLTGDRFSVGLFKGSPGVRQQGTIRGL